MCKDYFLIVGSLARVQTYVQANAKVSYNIHKKGVYRPIPGHSLNWQGVISMHLRIFSWSPGTEWVVFFGVGKISNIFWGFLKFLIFFGVKDRCWARAYVWRKTESRPLSGTIKLVRIQFVHCSLSWSGRPLKGDDLWPASASSINL